VDPQLVERVERNGGSLELWQGDITRLGPDVEAIANAANSSLLGGGGVDGAIHRAAGPALLDECERIGGCPTGEARITGAGRLPQQHVIHCVGPIYSAQNLAESARLLTATYRAALHLASERNLVSLAFPSISTGVYGYPQEAAASLALRTLLEHLDGGRAPRRLLMVLFGHDALAAYRAALRELLGDNGEGPRS
jgi:O-acetyl-ADP-ribose deacetylase (regulator of RNase III)